MFVNGGILVLLFPSAPDKAANGHSQSGQDHAQEKSHPLRSMKRACRNRIGHLERQGRSQQGENAKTQS